MLAIAVPQVFVQLPYAPQQAKVTDLFGILAIPVALLVCRYRGHAAIIAVATIAAIGFSCAVMMFRMLFDHHQHLYLREVPQLGRLFAIHSPLFLVAAMPTSREWLLRAMIGFAVVCISSSIVIGVLYHFGSSAFDAQQTYQREFGDRFHRLGGLAGETGAFAFNAMLGMQLLLAGIAIAEKRKLFWLLFCTALPLYLAFIYHESLVRISVLNTLVFALVSLVGVNRHVMSSRFAVIGFIVFGCILIPLLSAAGFPVLDVEIERASIDGNLNRFTSGRFDHWVAGIETTLMNPTYALFGMGYRAPEFVLGHPVENFFVFHLATYGLIGSAIFLTLYLVICLPVIRCAMTGDFGSGIFTALILAVLVQWQVNDVNLYYQAFPVALFFTAWFSIICVEERAAKEGNTALGKL